MKDLISKLENELKGKNEQQEIEKYEQDISKSIKEGIDLDSFYNLPFKNIFSILSKVDINDFEDPLSTMKKIITKTMEKHYNEKETLQLLYLINFSKDVTSLDDFISLLMLFTNCHFCVTIGELYTEQNSLVNPDYEYEIKKLNDKIELLKKPIQFPPVNLKPEDYEPDIVQAVEEGKLTSVQYLIEHEHFPVNKLGSQGYNALHNACFKGDLAIIIYLIEQQNADIEYKSEIGNTPLLYTCADEGHIYAFQYLVEKYHANIHAKNKYGRTCLHLACAYGHVIIADYLIQHYGFNIEEKDNEGNTPLHRAAAYSKNTEIIKYLLSKGANKKALNSKGKKPYDVISSESKGYINYSSIQSLLK